MKLISIESSRVTSLFRFGRIAGQIYLPEVALELSKRYEFFGPLPTFADLSSDKVTFSMGRFKGTAIKSLEIYGDGVAIESASDTDHVDDFFQDLVSLIEEFGVKMIKTHEVNKIYNSALMIEADPSILKPIECIKGVARQVESGLQEISGLSVSFEAFGWSFASDQSQNPSLKPIPFSVERMLGAEFSLNTFFSSAPLKTKQHIDILEKLEAVTSQC